MTVFCLVRHGSYRLLDHALGGRAEHPLDDAGLAQAARVAGVLAGGAIAAVVSSPVRRARETASVIASRLGLEVSVEADFSEIDFASWTGASFESLRGDPAWQAWNRFRSTAAVPDGETMLAVQARALGGLRRLAAGWPDREVVVVSHGDIIKSVLAHVLGAPLDLMRRIEIGPASTSRVALGADDATVLGINLPP